MNTRDDVVKSIEEMIKELRNPTANEFDFIDVGDGQNSKVDYTKQIESLEKIKGQIESGSLDDEKVSKIGRDIFDFQMQFMQSVAPNIDNVIVNIESTINPPSIEPRQYDERPVAAPTVSRRSDSRDDDISGLTVDSNGMVSFGNIDLNLDAVSDIDTRITPKVELEAAPVEVKVDSVIAPAPEVVTIEGEQISQGARFTIEAPEKTISAPIQGVAIDSLAQTIAIEEAKIDTVKAPDPVVPTALSAAPTVKPIVAVKGSQAKEVAPLDYAGVVAQANASVIVSNATTEVYSKDGWIWFKDSQIDQQKGVRLTGDRVYEAGDGSRIAGQSEFRIPFSASEDNMEKAYKVMREFYQNPPAGIKLPRNAKMMDIAHINEDAQRDPNKANTIVPESGPQFDQRGKELCFYVTWELDPETKQMKPSLTTEEYKAFIFEMIKALDKAGVQDIGYMASLSADQSFTKDGKRDDVPVLSTYIEYIPKGSYDADGKPIEIKELFSHNDEFKSAGFENPLRDLIITKEDIEKAGLTEIANKIAERQKEFLVQDAPVRIQNFADRIDAAVKDVAAKPKIGSSPERTELIENLKKSVESIKANNPTDIKLPDLTEEMLNKLPSDKLTALANGAKHVASEVKEHHDVVLKPTLDILQSEFKGSKDALEFSNNVLDKLKESNQQISKADEFKISKAAAEAYQQIKEVRAEKMNFAEKAVNKVMKAFGSKLSTEHDTGIKQSFVDKLKEQRGSAAKGQGGQMH